MIQGFRLPDSTESLWKERHLQLPCLDDNICVFHFFFQYFWPGSFQPDPRRKDASAIGNSYTFCEDWWFHWAKRPNKIFISSASLRMLFLVKRPLERIRGQICHFEHSHFPLNRPICKIKCKGIYFISHHYLNFVCFWLLNADTKIHMIYLFYQ